jgi:hypothetical protein
MAVVFLLFLFLVPLANALCQPGTDGTDGTGGTITVVNHGRCYTKQFSLAPTETMTVCNGLNGQAGTPPTIQMLNGSLTGCAQFTASMGGGSALFCNGTYFGQALAGIQGNVGPQGVPGISYLPVFTPDPQASGCTVVTGNGSAVLCNGTTGSIGINGTQGIAGPM